VSVEPTLPSERTRLAWQRTILAGIVCLLGVLRLLAEVSLPLLAVAAVMVLLGAVLVVAGAIRRAVGGRNVTSDTGVGRNAALLTAVVSLACLGAMAYVVLV
jgi:uncharacterized membrane protein YidH (DUF202 family)